MAFAQALVAHDDGHRRVQLHLVLDGVAHRLGGFDRIRSTKVEDEPTECEFELTGKAVKVRGRVASEPHNFVAWVYADPAGPEHNTLNCSIADLELTVERKGAEPRRLESIGAAAYEIGMRETDHGIPVQPYPDGEPELRRTSVSVGWGHNEGRSSR